MASAVICPASSPVFVEMPGVGYVVQCSGGGVPAFTAPSGLALLTTEETIEIGGLVLAALATAAAFGFLARTFSRG